MQEPEVTTSVHTIGAVYEFGQQWPDDKAPEQLLVGPMFVLGLKEDGWEMRDREGDLQKGGTTQPPMTEIWCWTAELIGAYEAFHRRIINRSEVEVVCKAIPLVKRRIIPMTGGPIAMIDQAWDSLRAFDTVSKRMADLRDAMEEDDGDDEPSPPQPQPAPAQA